VCAAEGFPCQEGFDCCTNFCDPNGQCAPPPCGQQGNACGADADCCTGHCFDLLQVCSTGECAPDLFDCNGNTECCSGYCDPMFKKCGEPLECAELGDPCLLGPECCTTFCQGDKCACVPTGGACAQTSQCCTDECNGEVCGKLQCLAPGTDCVEPPMCCSGHCEELPDFASKQCCAAPGCTHEVCEEGLPLSATECMGDCVATICAADPYCCCVSWDNVCVSAVPDKCMMACMTPT
jgi:hypothetical protein